MARGGRLAAEGQFGPAGELIQAAIGIMNRAVVLAPADLDVRLIRGLSYGAFPAFYKLSATARDDLEAAIQHPKFESLPKDRRDRVLELLDRLKLQANGGVASWPDRFPNVAPDTSPIL